MEQVRPGRVAIIAGVLIAGFVGAAFCIRTVPDGVLSLVGGPEGGIARFGGLRLRFTPAPGTEERYLHELAHRTSVARVGDAFVLEFPRIAEDMAMHLAEVLGGGGLRMYEALETDYARQIGPSAEVTVEDDSWRADDGSDHTNAYLRGPSPEALDRAIAAAKQRGWQPAPNTTILYERVEPWADSEEREPYWRSYEVVATAEIDGSMIANAMTSYEPYASRPVVLVDFTREGGDRFAELTERITGRKLATVLGTRVYSAPIINSAIRGGRASISMGGGRDVEAQEREAQMLTEVLRKGMLPIRGKVDASQWTPPPDLSSYEWLGRILLAAIAGLGFGLVVFATIRLIRPQWGARPLKPEGGGTTPWRRILVTLAAPVVLIVGSRIVMPGVNGEELDNFIEGSDRTQVSVLALGVTPLLIAFFLVELVALVIPALRWRRHDPLGRVPLGQAVAALAIGLALVQSYFIATNIESYESHLLPGFGGTGPSNMALVDPGWAFRISAMATLVTGTLVLAIVAGMIREHGLGNGYGALFLSGSVIEFLRIYIDEPTFVPELLVQDALGLVAIVVIGAITAAMLRWRIGQGREPSLRVPTSGVSPLGDSQALAYLFALVSLLGLGTELSLAMMRVTELQSRTYVIIGLVLVTVPLWSWLFARPRLVPGVTMASWLRATVLSIVALVAIAAIQWFATKTDDHTAALVHAINIMIGTAVVLDIRDDLRAHRQRLAPVAVLHQIQRAGIAERVLTDAGIPFHLQAGHLRTLFAFFGPFAPAIVMVPEVHAIEARGKLAEASQITTPPRAIAKVD